MKHFRRGFAQNVAAHLLYFQAPGLIFGPRGRFVDPGMDFWTPDQIWGFSGRHSGPGTFLGDCEVPKKVLLRGKDFLVRIQGNPPLPNEFYVT